MNAPAGNRRHLSASPFNTPRPTPPIEQFAVRDRVTHDTYGLGHVIGVEEGVAVLVDFGSHRTRVTTPFAKMTKL